MPETQVSVPARILRTGSGLSWIAVAIGLAGVAGTALHEPLLSTFGSGNTISANTAVCLIVLGLCTTAREREGWRAHVRTACALAVLAVGLLTLAEYAVGRSFGIDELLFSDTDALVWGLPPGRMAPFAASGLVFLSLGLVGLDSGSSKRVHPAELASGAAMTIGLIALLEHAYGSGMVLPQVGGGLALPGACGLIAIAGAMLCARPERGAMATFAGPHLGGLLLRRALLPVTGTAALGGLACALAVRRDLLTLPAALATATVGFLVLAAAVLVRMAFLLEQVDAERSALLADLESRVQQRTAGLTAANEELERQRKSLEDALFRIRASEAALAHARDEALNLSRIKSEFLGNITHELRTPMNGVIGMLDILADTPIDPSQSSYLGIARTSATDLLALIDDILDVTRLEAGQLKLIEAPFELDEIVQRALDPWRHRASRQGLTLTAMIQTGIPAQYVGDARRISQVLGNLVSNAVKFTRQGLVRVQVEAGMTGAGWRLRVSVQDTGAGIPPERRSELFVPFTQLDGSVTRSFGGVGLGLALSAQLVDLMDGAISVESEVGVGSIFSYEVPVTAAAEIPSNGEPRGYARTALGS